MNKNIHNVELLSNPVVTLVCPSCNTDFQVTAGVVNDSLVRGYKTKYCSKTCAVDGRRLTKEVLGLRILSFYFDCGRVPTLKDMKFNTIYRRTFGGWKKALEFVGLLCLEDALGIAHANSWSRQRTRANNLKKKYVKQFGNCCSSCGYTGNYAVLCFHHIDPAKKTMSLDARSLGNLKETSIEAELQNCALLCMNCHTALHNPDLAMA